MATKRIRKKSVASTKKKAKTQKKEIVLDATEVVENTGNELEAETEVNERIQATTNEEEIEVEIQGKETSAIEEEATKDTRQVIWAFRSILCIYSNNDIRLTN